MTHEDEAILMKHIKNFMALNNYETLGMLMVNGHEGELIPFLQAQAEINNSFPTLQQLTAAVNIKAYNLD